MIHLDFLVYKRHLFYENRCIQSKQFKKISVEIFLCK
jgi:hypothetical protein